MIGSTLTFIEQRRKGQLTTSDIFNLYFKARYALRNDHANAFDLFLQFKPYRDGYAVYYNELDRLLCEYLERQRGLFGSEAA